jgi:hypothetical protein
LVLSEIYYDHPGDDTGLEWVEIFNGTDASIDLSGYSLGYGGADYTYGAVQLGGTILAGECIVVGGPTSIVGNFSPDYADAFDFDPDLQNSGGVADGVALFDTTAITTETVPIDAVIYGGANTNDLIDSNGASPAPHVGDAAATRTIERTLAGWQINESPSPNDCTALQ